MTATSGEDGLPIVELRFESLRNLQEDLGPFLAQEGIFLQGMTEFGPSDVVRFKIMLPGDFVLVEGAGVIIWVRGESEAGPLHPAGAAMGFATLSEQGRELVEQMVQTHCEGDGRPFDLTRPATSEESTEGQEEPRPTSEDLAGMRLTIRGEPESAPEAVNEAGKVVADAVAESPSPETLEEVPSLPFVDDPIEQLAVGSDEIDDELSQEDEIIDAGTAEEGVDEMSLAEFGDSILEPEPEPEPDHDDPESASGEPSPDVDEESDEDGREDWQRLEEILEPAEPETSPEEPEPVDAATVLEPVLEAAEEFAGRDSDEDLDADEGDDPGPAFGGEQGDRGGVYLEDNFLTSIEAAAETKSRKNLLYGGLAVVVIVAAWLVWSYMSGEWPFAAAATSASPVATESGEPPSDHSGEISDAELEAVVSAAVDAVVQNSEGADPGDEPGSETATAGAGDGAQVPVASVVASKVEDVRWEPRAEGTVIVIRADGKLHESRVRVEPLSSPPRVLIRLKGIVEPYRPLEIAVDGTDVRLMRMGHHPEKRPPSLWIVLDVNDPGITAKGVDVEGDTARILVGR